MRRKSRCFAGCRENLDSLLIPRLSLALYCCRVHISQISDVTGASSALQRGEWRSGSVDVQSTSGGMYPHPNWRSNPQIAVTFAAEVDTAERAGSLGLAIASHSASNLKAKASTPPDDIVRSVHLLFVRLIAFVALIVSVGMRL